MSQSSNVFGNYFEEDKKIKPKNQTHQSDVFGDYFTKQAQEVPENKQISLVTEPEPIIPVNKQEDTTITDAIQSIKGLNKDSVFSKAKDLFRYAVNPKEILNDFILNTTKKINTDGVSSVAKEYGNNAGDFFKSAPIGLTQSAVSTAEGINTFNKWFYDKVLGGKDIFNNSSEEIYQKDAKDLKVRHEELSALLTDMVGEEDIDKFWSQAGQGLGQGIGQLGASFVNPALGLTVISGQSIASGKDAYDVAYNTVIENGGSEEEAKKIGNINGYITGAVNMAEILPIGKALGFSKKMLFNPVKKVAVETAEKAISTKILPTLWRVGKTGIWESVTEGVQDLVSSATAKYTYDDTQEPLGQALNSFLISLPTSIFFGTVGEAGTRLNINKLKKAKEGMVEKSMEAGMDKETAEAFTTMILNNVVTGSDSVYDEEDFAKNNNEENQSTIDITDQARQEDISQAPVVPEQPVIQETPIVPNTTIKSTQEDIQNDINALDPEAFGSSLDEILTSVQNSNIDTTPENIEPIIAENTKEVITPITEENTIEKDTQTDIVQDNQPVKHLDSIINKIIPPEKGETFWTVEIGMEESLGENGNNYTGLFKEKPTLKQVEEEILNYYKGIVGDLGGKQSLSNRDEKILNVAEKVLGSQLDNKNTEIKERDQKEIADQDKSEELDLTTNNDSYNEWIKKYEPAVKEANGISDKAKTITDPKLKKKFLKEHLDKFQSKYINKFDKLGKQELKPQEETLVEETIPKDNKTEPIVKLNKEEQEIVDITKESEQENVDFSKMTIEELNESIELLESMIESSAVNSVQDTKETINEIKKELSDRQIENDNEKDNEKLYDAKTEFEYTLDGKKQTGRAKYDIYPDEDYVMIDNNTSSFVGDIPIGRIDRVKLSDLTKISNPNTLIEYGNDDTNDTGNTDTKTDSGESGELQDTTDVSGETDSGSSEELNREVSGYDSAIDLVESGNGLGGDRPDFNGIESLSKKQRQLINEQVENLLIEKKYSKDSNDYTQEEIDLLSNYTGSGGKESVGATGKGLLSEYYTPQKLVNKLWDIVNEIVPNAGTAFEPSAGTGRIITSSPVSVAMDGAEISEVSGTIAQVLNPASKITIGDFQEIFFDKKTGKEKKNISQYDVLIGNPPFGERTGFIKGKGEESKINRQEEYFIKRGLDMTKDGGVLIYVVNSSFLKKGSSEGKRLISSLGKLERAYRLPENIFEDTSIGTDIVVFRKTPAIDGTAIALRSMEISGDTYFRGVIGGNNILGETLTRKDRFGKLESYVKGDLDSALAMIKVDPVVNEIIENAKEEKKTKPRVIKETVTEKIDGKEKKVRKERVKKSDEEVSEQKTQVLPAETGFEDSVTASQNFSSNEIVDNNNIEVTMLERIERDGSIPNVENKELPYVSYENGKFYPNGLYFSGDTYAKLDQLLLDKQAIIDNYGEEQYNKQSDGIKAIVPTKVPLKDILFDPLDRHIVMKMVDNGKGEQTILLNLFTQYLRKGGYATTGIVTKYEIQAYVTNERLPNKSADKLPQIKEDSKRLFNVFIKTVLDQDIQKSIVDQYNKEKNSYVMPDYSKIPVKIDNMSKDFRGKEFKPSRVQQNGVGFLVNKGSGLIMYGVGVGKTHTMLMATVANMQKGWTKRPLFIVPSATISKTWIATIRQMFPGITINNLSGLQAPVIKRLQKERGTDTKKWINDGEISIISHQGILKIGFNEEQITNLTGDLTDALWAEPKTNREAEKQSEKVNEMAGVAQKYATDVMLSDLGIDHISVDEVHNFRKIFMGAKTEEDIPGSKKRFGNVEGGGTPAIRAQQLFLISQYIQKNNGNRNVFLASATPFENKATEVYNILSLIARDRMKSMGIFNINDFFTAFADFEVEQDMKLDGSVKDTLKMKRFSNVQQLQKLLKEFIDYQEDKTLVRPERKVITHHLQMSPLQMENAQKIQNMLEGIDDIDEETGAISYSSDTGGVNGKTLKAATYSISNSVSPYFIKEYQDGASATGAEIIEQSPKIKYAVETIKTFKNNPKTKDYGTFLFFGKHGVEYHQKISEEIAKQTGYSKEEVGVISGSSITDEQKEQIKDDFNSGKIKILIGGDQTKEGIDLQNNGFAMINLALGWNPTQITQVEGRVWRQGNKRNIAPIIYPLVENSGDAFIYNKFEEKASRTNNLMGYAGQIFDIGEIDPAEKKVALLTDPAKRTNMVIAIEIAKVNQQTVIIDTEIKELKGIKTDIQTYKENIDYYTEEVASYEKYVKENPDDKYYKEKLTSRKSELKSNKDKLKRLEAKLASKEIVSIDSHIDELNEELLQVDDLKKKINESAEEKLKYFTEMRKTEIANQKTIPDFMEELNALADQTAERTPEEITEIKKGLIEKLEREEANNEDVAEMADFIVTPRKDTVKKGTKNQIEDFNSKGKQEILNNLKSLDLNEKERQAVEYFVEMIPEDILGNTTLSIEQKGGSSAVYNFNTEIIKMFIENIRKSNLPFSKVFIHEMWHKLSQYLPLDVISNVRKDFEAQKAEYLKNNPWFSNHIEIKQGGISQQEYEDIVAKFPYATNAFNFNEETNRYTPSYFEENYRFKSLDEFIAETMTDYSLDRVNELTTDTKGVIFNLKNIFRLFVESVQRFFGFNNSSLIFKNITDGKYMDMQRRSSIANDTEAYFDLLKFRKDSTNEMREEMENIKTDSSFDATKKDIGTMIGVLGNAQDIYLSDENSFPEAKEIIKTSESRTQKKRIIDSKILEVIKPYAELKQAERNAVDKVLVEGNKEGIEYSEAELLNKGLSSQQINAYKSIRKGLNMAFNVLISEMEKNGTDPEEIETFKRERKGYIPARWKNKYVVKTQMLKTPDADPNDNSNWKTDRVDDFKYEKQAKKEFEKRRINNRDIKTRYILDRFENLSVDWFSQQAMSLGNIKTLFEQSSSPQQIKDTMLDSIRDLFKSKGFGRHFIHRTDVQGYQETNLHEVLADYFTGFSGFVTKMEAGKKYFDSLAKIDARKQKKYYENMRDLIAYDMAGNTDGGTVINAMKQVTFIYSLTNDLSFLIVNLTQNFVIGTGELSKLYTDRKEAVYRPEIDLLNTFKDMATGNLSQKEQEVVSALLEVGELGAEMIGDMIGFKNNPIYGSVSKGLGFFLNKATGYSEQINRVASFITARRILEKQGYDETMLNEKALEVSRDINFRYGKIHKAPILRGKVANLVFMYYQYMRSFLFAMQRDLSKGEFLALSRKMIYTVALGGVSALPFAKLLQIALRSITGEDDDKKELTKMDILLEKGIPATYLDVDMSDRVSIDIMSLSKMAEQFESKDATDTLLDMRNYIGAVGNLFTNRIPTGVSLLLKGRTLDGLSRLLPDMVGNPLKAVSGAKYGVLTTSGTPLKDVNTGEPLKYTTYEAIVKATGFVPTREALAWDAKNKEWRIKDDLASIRETAIVDATKEWEQSGKTGDIKQLENELVLKMYGSKATDLQKNQVRKEFAVRRTYGANEKWSSMVLDANTNEEKAIVLKQARESLGKDAFKEFFVKGRKEVLYKSGASAPILISDDLYQMYTNPKKSVNTSSTKKTSAEDNLLKAYAQAFLVSPKQAVKGILTKEKLERVNGNLVEFERFYGIDFNANGGSEEYVKKQLLEMGIPWNERSKYNLEHIVPRSAGGGNESSNLKIVDRDTHNSWTPFDIAVGKSVESKKLTMLEASKIAKDYKSGKITKAEALELIK